jgi:hypothetical protein
MRGCGAAGQRIRHDLGKPMRPEVASAPSAARRPAAPPPRRPAAPHYPNMLSSNARCSPRPLRLATYIATSA